MGWSLELAAPMHGQPLSGPDSGDWSSVVGVGESRLRLQVLLMSDVAPVRKPGASFFTLP